MRWVIGKLRFLKLGIIARFLYALIFLSWLAVCAVYLWWTGMTSVEVAWTSGFVFHASLWLLGSWLAAYALLMLYSAFAESPVIRKNFVHGRGGSARFAGPWVSLMHNWRLCRKAPIYLGKTLAKYDPWPWRQHVGVDDKNHLVTIAQSGSGKSTTAIWPNLLKYSYPDSVFILDPKGEHALFTSRAREALGPVYILDPQGLVAQHGLKTVGFNPLDQIDVTAGDAKERFRDIGVACYVSNQSKQENPHFKKTTIALIAGLAAHLKSWPKYPASMHNLPGVHQLLLRGQVPETAGNKFDPQAFEVLLQEMTQNPAAGKSPMHAVELVRRAGANELGSIFTSALTAIEWAASDNMASHLRSSELDLTVLRKEICTIYVVLRDDDMHPDKLGIYMRVLITQALRVCREVKIPAARARAGRRTLFILDEVGMLGPMSAIVGEAYKIMRHYNTKLWTFFQNYGTIEACYDDQEALLGNSTTQYFGIKSDSTAEAIAGALGKFREVRPTGSGDGSGYYETVKPLLDPTEITDTLKQEELLQIVHTGGGHRFELTREPTYPNSVGGYKRGLVGRAIRDEISPKKKERYTWQETFSLLSEQEKPK